MRAVRGTDAGRLCRCPSATGRLARVARRRRLVAYGARLLSGFGLNTHRGFKSRRLRGTREPRRTTSGGAHALCWFRPHSPRLGRRVEEYRGAGFGVRGLRARLQRRRPGGDEIDPCFGERPRLRESATAREP